MNPTPGMGGWGDGGMGVLGESLIFWLLVSASRFSCWGGGRSQTGLQ
ncbi:hypothetical protein K9N68_03450 [Kovacikia minuta CCNUW1]|nr:hypothetical protein [Kovacikia minuta]UBF27047.1 hypothetical protein K9N68_03450 [Kovacikia minuta CCNUW1]